MGNSTDSVIMALIVLSNKWSKIGGMERVERLHSQTKQDSMKQWVELESAKAENKTFGNRLEDKWTTKDVGLDKEEETEEALILAYLGVHSKSMQTSECMGAWGLLANFLPQGPSLWTWQIPHRPSWGKPLLCKVWPSDRLSQCDHLVHRLDKAWCQSSVGIPEGL